MSDSDNNPVVDENTVIELPTPVPPDRNIRLDENQGTLEGGYNQEFNHPVTTRTEPMKVTPSQIAGVAKSWKVFNDGEREVYGEQVKEDTVLVKGDGEFAGGVGDWIVIGVGDGEVDIIGYDEFGLNPGKLSE